MLLWHEEGVETPETRFDELSCWHLSEADNAVLYQFRRVVVRQNQRLRYPISIKIFRNSSRTLSKGCNAPPFGGIPSASKLYFLNLAVFHAPLHEEESEGGGFEDTT